MTVTSARERPLASLARRLVGTRELITLGVCLVLFIGFTAANPKFASPDSVLGIVRRIVPISILATGVTFLLISAEIDLSIGANFGFCSVLLGELASQRHGDPWLSAMAVILVGFGIGAINGLLVTRVGLPSFVTTIGMLAALRGVSNAVTGGVGTYAKDTEQSFYQIMSGNLPGTRLPDIVVIMVVVMLIGAAVLATTRFGSDVFATGGNAEAARNNGINTRRVKLICFVVTGGLCGLAGVMQFGWIQYVPGNTGVGFELQAIAACIIGGVGLFGGRGSVAGSLLGALIVSMLTSGLILAGFRDYWDGVAAGVVMVVAVGLDVLVRRGVTRSVMRALHASS